ncbi:hypothetical protein AAFF_G00378810 [Aldrovandia affinis]|uniref:SH3 domain-containing protein n=1 Tax=Aldrovandia affinis TaxID=143900 RepID=A0AAD7WMK6_9TELE|nr:hypothetical protein AAFF_G00378810 [Aldrovandia affinis]
MKSQDNSTAILNLQQTTAGPMKITGAKENGQKGVQPREAHLYTRVVQHHSCFCPPPVWSYPLSLAFGLWNSQQEKPNEITVEVDAGIAETHPGHSAVPSLSIGERCRLPEALPLRCPSPHQHRWNFRDSLQRCEQDPEQGLRTEVVKVLWCQGVVYRLINGAITTIEISPGDGSVIRSNGAVANYFTHHTARLVPGQSEEKKYFVNSLPPDVPGQVYSVCSAVTRASRILKCYNQARLSLKLPNSHCCWREESSSLDSSVLIQEAHVAGSGHFMAFSDGRVHVIFLDGLTLQMIWNFNTSTLTEGADRVIQPSGEAAQPHGWCQFVQPDGQRQLIQLQAPGSFSRYVSAAVQWCQWVEQTTQNRGEASCAIQSIKPGPSWSVVAELEKIKRFNFLLEHSGLLRTAGDSAGSSRGLQEVVSRSDPGTASAVVTESSIAEALQRTTRAIQDIETLLSDRQVDVRNIMARFNPSSSSEEAIHGGRAPNLAGPPIAALGAILQTRRAAQESTAAGAVSTQSPKPSFLKGGVPVNNSPPGESGKQGFPKPRALASRLENANEDRSPPSSKQQPFRPKPLEQPQDDKPKSRLAEVPLKKPSLGNILPDAKLAFPKLPPTFDKPSSVADSTRSGDGGSGSVLVHPKIPYLPKPKSSVMMIQSQLKKGGGGESAGVKPHLRLGLKSSSFSGAHMLTSKKDENNDPSAPKRKPLPSSFALGSPPSKPVRPPNVNLRKFKNGAGSLTEDLGLKQGGPPAPIFHPSNHMFVPPQPSHPSAPSLRPQSPGATASKKRKEQSKQREKEERKIQEQEKNEQKEREKKEQEIRKRFKLSGPIQQGELIEIVHNLDNPGGCWLGRTQDGSYGYVKIESVEIDDDKLKRQQRAGLLPSKADEDPEVYDDVSVLDDSSSGLKGQAVRIPPMPEEDGDLYDDLGNPSLHFGLPPPPPPFIPEGSIANDIYDDVDSQRFRPPPLIGNLTQIKSKTKSEEKDPKKQKKFLKEEKEFRKKFKFEGEIRVLYQVAIVSTLTPKKWGGKDLQLKPGEKIDVIVKPSDSKLIGRNQDGKIGYVLMDNIVVDDADMYDAIGEGCVYDND